MSSDNNRPLMESGEASEGNAQGQDISRPYRWLGRVAIAALALLYIFHLFIQGGGMFYFVKRPTFALSSLHLPVFNVDVEGRLTSMLHINLTTRNPNWISNFDYDELTVTASSNGTLIGDGLLSALYHRARETAMLSVVVTSDARKLSPEVASYLRKGSRILLKIYLESEVKVDSWLVETIPVGVEVHCKGITLPVPKEKANPPPHFPSARCRAMFRFTITLTVLEQIWETILQACDAIGKILLG